LPPIQNDRHRLDFTLHTGIDQKSLAIPGHVIRHQFRATGSLAFALKSATGAPELKFAPSFTGTASIFSVWVKVKKLFAVASPPRLVA